MVTASRPSRRAGAGPEPGAGLGAGAGVGRVVHGGARHAGSRDRAEHDPRDLGASIAQLEWTVNAYTLSFAVLLMTAAAHRRPVRRTAVFAAGLVLRGRVGRLRTFTRDRLAERRGWAGSGPDSNRRGADRAERGDTRSARLGDGDLRRAPPGGARWALWKRHTRARGRDLRSTSIARACAGRADGRELRVASRWTCAGLETGTGAALGLVWGLVRGSSAGWGSPEVTGRSRAERCWWWLSSRWERHARAPMLPMRLFARAVLRRQRGDLLPECLHERSGVLHGAVPAGRPGAGPARARAAAAPVGRWRRC